MYIYKMTRDNGEYYIGKRITDANPLKDNYFGSGTLFKKKYTGTESQWDKEILECCNSPKELSEREEHWIGDLYRRDASNDGGLCLNLCAGGDGGATRVGNSGLKGKDRTEAQRMSSTEHSKKMSGREGPPHTTKERENIKQRMTGAGNHRANHTKFSFIHKDFDPIVATGYEMRALYPELDNIIKVGTGERKICHGWKLNKETL